VLAAFAAAAYGNSFSTGFALDNRALILQDPRVHEATSANVDLILNRSYWWPIGESGLYRPVTTLSYLFNYAVLGNGDQPFGYHLVNVTLHIANVLLAYALLSRLFAFSPIAFCTAAIWAVHPLSTEAVTNIVGRADLIAALAVLGGLLLYIKSNEAIGSSRVLWTCALAALTVIGVFAKESAVVVGGVIALYAVCSVGGARGVRRAAVALAVPLLILWMQRARVLGAVPPAEFPFVDNPITGAGFFAGRLTALVVVAKYLMLVVWPATLSADYSYAQIPLVSGRASEWIALVAMATVAGATVLLWRRSRTLFFFVAFSIITLLPASNLLFSSGTIMAERVMYLPSLGVLALVVAGLDHLAQPFHQPKALPVVAGVLVVVLATRTWMRNHDWRDDVTLWSATVQAAPESFKAHRGLAEALYESDPTHANLARVVDEVDRATAVLDRLPPAVNDVKTFRMAGAYHLERGDALQGAANLEAALKVDAKQSYERSVSSLRRAVAIAEAAGRGQPGAARPLADVYRVLSAAYTRVRDSAGAVDAASRALTLEPLNAVGYRQAAAAFLSARRDDDAAVALMTGSMVTDDRTLRDELVELYRRGLDPLGCAVTDTPQGPAINPACSTVARHACAATNDAARIQINAGRSDQAQRLRDGAARQFSCP
jgi:tetratricopeptide (TPR) repeat protein